MRFQYVFFVFWCAIPVLVGLSQESTLQHAADPKTPATETTEGAGLLDADFNSAPTFIKSDSLLLKSQDHFIEYKGHVEVLHQDMKMTCDLLQATYKGDNTIDKLVALKNVFITKGPNIRARGEKAVYDKASETITLTENPELQQDGSVLTADQIRIFIKEDRSVAEGEVRVKLTQTEPDASSRPNAPQGRRGKGALLP